jgi:hypothetical protein
MLLAVVVVVLAALALLAQWLSAATVAQVHQTAFLGQRFFTQAVVAVALKLELLALAGLALAVMVKQALALLQPQDLQIVAAAVAALVMAHLAVMAVLASSSFPMLAHNNLVAVSSLLLVVTPFIHLLHQALFPHCLH